MDTQSHALKRACSSGDLDEVQRLLANGADPNASDEHGQGTLLTFHPDVIETLLAAGADPNRQTNENGSSVLAGLAFVNKFDCVRLLLEHGADANRGREASGETPLHHALVSKEDRSSLVKLLLDHGADPNAKTNPGVVTLNYGIDVRTRGETPLHRAAAYASVEVIEMLLMRGADITNRDANGDSPLTWACWHLRERGVIHKLDPKRRVASG